MTKMGDLVVPKHHELPTEFDPKKTREKISVLKAAIQHAKDMGEWERGMKAAEWMTEEQTDFVAWWHAAVTPGKSPGSNQHKRLVADQRQSITATKAEKETGISKQQVDRWGKELKRPGYQHRLFRPSHHKAMADGAQRRSDLQTGEMEWFTPALYIEKARRVLGSIDLDPASCAEAQVTVKANKWFGVEDDGLKQKWSGKVWLNPPYAGALVAKFAQKIIEAWQARRLSSAIMLTNAYTETSWFHNLAKASNAVCFTRGRIKFLSPHGEKCSPTNGQSLFYFGNDIPSFTEQFADVGLIMVRP
jgi:phage N-6-adenine-methyltransferase